MAKPGRPSPGPDDYLYWQDRLSNREASGVSIDEFCVDEDISRSTFYRWVERLKEGIPDAVKEEQTLTLADIASSRLAACPRFNYLEVASTIRWDLYQT